MLPGALSVKEAMTYTAQLRLRNYRGQQGAAQVVDGILAELGLTDVADSPIGIPWASDFEVPEARLKHRKRCCHLHPAGCDQFELLLSAACLFTDS